MVITEEEYLKAVEVITIYKKSLHDAYNLEVNKIESLLYKSQGGNKYLVTTLLYDTDISVRLYNFIRKGIGLKFPQMAIDFKLSDNNLCISDLKELRISKLNLIPGFGTVLRMEFERLLHNAGLDYTC